MSTTHTGKNFPKQREVCACASGGGGPVRGSSGGGGGGEEGVVGGGTHGSLFQRRLAPDGTLSLNH